MKPITIIIFLFFIQLNLNGQNFEWAYRKVGSGFPTFGVDVTCDSSGNAYNLFNAYSNNGHSIITKVSPDGIELASRSFIGSYFSNLKNLECIHDSLYSAIRLDQKFQFDSVYLISQGYFDVAGVKMDLNATCLYGKNGGSAAVINNESSAAFVPDQFNNMYLFGNYYAIANFNGDTIISAGNSDIVLAKYYPNKTLYYLKSMGGAGHDSAVCMSVTPTNGIVVCGNYESDFIVDGDTLHSAGMHDIFITKFSSTGQLLWSKSLGSTLDDKISKCDIDTAGNIYVTGTFNNGFLVDGNTYNSNGGKDIFIIKFAKGGNLIWIKAFGSSYDDAVADIKINTAQDVYIGGTFTDTIGLGSHHRISISNYDLFVLKINSVGDVQWLISAGAADSNDVTKNCYLTGLAPDLYGNIYVSGTFRTQSGFGGVTLLNLGIDESFIAKINDSFQVTTNDSIYCEGDSIIVSVDSPISFDPSNYFTYELSDNLGYFHNNIIDTIYTSSSNFQFSFALPAINYYSNNYQIRVRSSNPKFISVSDDFKFFAHANSISGPTQVCTGQQVLLHAENKNELSFQWLINDSVIPGAIDSTYLTQFGQGGIYNYVISNYCFTDTSADFNLTGVTTIVPIFIIPLDTMNVNCADTLNLNYYVIPTGGFFSGYYVHDSLFIPPLFNNNFLPIYYTHTDSLGCSYIISDSLHLHFDDYIQISGFPPGPLCHSNPPFLLITTPPGGTFTSNCGNCVQGNTFYPSFAPYLQNFAFLTYSIQGIYGCEEQKTIQFVVDNCLGIDVADANQLNCIYNQNSNALEFSNLKNGDVNVNVFSVEGRLLLKLNLNSNTENAVISLNNSLSNGIYFVAVEDNNSKYNFKFIVNR